MSTAEDRITQEAPAKEKPRAEKQVPFVERALKFLSSVRLGVSLLCIMVLFSVTGMVIMQQNVEGFAAYYVGLTPSEKLLGSWLVIFDIYHSWYFNALLLLLSLNIILASIDHFPGAWSYVVKKKTTASPMFLSGQPAHMVIEMRAADTAEAIDKIKAAFKKRGLRSRITELPGRTDVFGESGTWNRLGAYGVHVFLLTLFLGHFVALQTGFDADVQLMPGTVTNQIQIISHQLDPVKGVSIERYIAEPPFTITCTDIQQKLVDPNGSIDLGNTMDWKTSLRIDDPVYGTRDVDVSLNKPFSYRGYRFFQASAITQGSARTMTLDVTPQSGGEPFQITLQRNGATDLPDGTKVEYQAFFSDFTIVDGKPDSASAEYRNPAVVLKVTTPQGKTFNAYAFGAKLPDNAPIGAPVAGYKWHLGAYEKSPLAHVLSIKYDPFYGSIIAWYIGGFGVIMMLILIYFFAHRRIWAAVENTGEGVFKVSLGGNTNRNHFAFEDRFKKIVAELETKASNS
ncbi:MAG TPA: cytochrome c biogenesis protein ResB [Pyrinomonadaceae bacterium]|jgi:cytochrome c biogenesis protein|nr:cytochrome c biogenesis protein ResB [Pyrinomonadaceae bacterium]